MGSMKTAEPIRGSSRKVDVNYCVVPIATEERSLIPILNDAIRPIGISYLQKQPLFDLTVATDQSMVFSRQRLIPTTDNSQIWIILFIGRYELTVIRI
ncbi:MAG: hypothetical protein EZS28_049555 [Streblomastix strix]|uniref:Uncharacterized protein n=1 Tax=Streblomastix strix TaxID=222440 RepID=A0A5J4T9S7_9EUKA|nr:MAG: hypothetical protein EZS28_049555 [Streblomastix strix]